MSTNTRSGSSGQERSTAKGRRRRAAAEQRRIEQQRWGLHDKDDDSGEEFVATPPTRRRNRRSSRRNTVRIESSDDVYSDDNTLDIALALSLSLTENPVHTHTNQDIPLDMSYESLVQLESVKCVASSTLVDSFERVVFVKGHLSESCVICQNEYGAGETLARLPCKHDMHEACGSEWLLKYSKLCPVCKVDVTEHH